MIQSVARAFKILETIKKAPNESINAATIARKLDLDRTTAFNLIKTMRELGYINQKPNKDYIIGDNIYSLAHGNFAVEKVASLIEPFCQSFTDEVNERSVVSAVLAGLMTSVVAISPKQAVTVSPDYTGKNTLYCTASGRLLLSRHSSTDLENIIETSGFPKKSWKNIDTLKKLESALKPIRQQDCYKHISDCSDIVAWARIIKTPDGYPQMSIGCYVPSYRATPETEKLVLRNLDKYSKQIAETLN